MATLCVRVVFNRTYFAVDVDLVTVTVIWNRDFITLLFGSVPPPGETV